MSWKTDTERLDEILSIGETTGKLIGFTPPETDKRDERTAFVAYVLGVLSVEAAVLAKVRELAAQLIGAAGNEDLPDLAKRSREIVDLMKISREQFSFSPSDYGVGDKERR